MNSRAKGKRGEREFIDRHLAAVWPDACRNLDQYGDDKRDVLRCAGIHWQIKRTERLDLWGAITQAQTEAIGDDLPVIAFRRNRSGWFCIVEASELVELLALKERIAT
jgi:hypothetical protein